MKTGRVSENGLKAKSTKNYNQDDVVRKLQRQGLNVVYEKINGRSTNKIIEVTAKERIEVGIKLLGMIDYLKVPFRRVKR